jgi:hypothetical protein
MQNLQHAIVSENMVWLWYYDEYGGKHMKELWAKDALDFIKSRNIEPDPSQPATTAENKMQL